MLGLLKYIHKKEWMLVLLGTLFIVLQVFLDLKSPDYMKDMMTEMGQQSLSVKAVLNTGLIMLGLAIASALLAVVVGMIASYISAQYGYRLRRALFEKVGDLSLENIKSFSTASLITRTTNDITQVQMVITFGMQIMIKAPILAVWALLKISSKHWQWTLLTGGVIFILAFILLVVFIFVFPKFRQMQALIDNLNKKAQENITGVRVVRAYNAEAFETAKFERENKKVADNSWYTGKAFSFVNPLFNFVISGMSLGIYWIGSYIIQNTSNIALKLDVFGDMTVFMIYAMQVVMAFMMLVMIFFILPRAMVSAKRIQEVLKQVPSIQSGDFQPETISGDITFNHVYFTYPNATKSVLTDIDFSIKRGQKVAFIGSTGSGKSTLLELIPRFYDVTKGELLIDGKNIKSYDLATLNEHISYVSQKAVLFSGNIKDNISLGQEQSEVQVEEALKVAQASFALSLDEGVNSHVAQNGTNFSGGQKQRLSIARALYKKPSIILFDDSFSALDYQTDLNLRKALDDYAKDTTTIIVAQRIGTIRDCDQIVVLDQGSIVGIGTHKALLNTCKIYQEIAYSQLSEEEVEDEKNNG